MDLKKVIIIRHGNYGSDDRINSSGIYQMEDNADKIRAVMGSSKNIALLSSSAPRAEDSAIVLSEALDIPYTTYKEFWSDNQHYENYDRALALLKTEVEKRNVDTVVLVTHMEYANYLPRIIIKDAGKDFMAHTPLEKGEMLVIDLEKEVSQIY